MTQNSLYTEYLERFGLILSPSISVPAVCSERKLRPDSFAEKAISLIDLLCSSHLSMSNQGDGQV